MKKLVTFILTFVSIVCFGGCNAESQSIGIIGGADGPTAVFVGSNINWFDIFGVIGIIAVVVFVLVFINKKRKK